MGVIETDRKGWNPHSKNVNYVLSFKGDILVNRLIVNNPSMEVTSIDGPTNEISLTASSLASTNARRVSTFVVEEATKGLSNDTTNVVGDKSFSLSSLKHITRSELKMLCVHRTAVWKTRQSPESPCPWSFFWILNGRWNCWISPGHTLGSFCDNRPRRRLFLSRAAWWTWCVATSNQNGLGMPSTQLS